MLVILKYKTCRELWCMGEIVCWQKEVQIVWTLLWHGWVYDGWIYCLDSLSILYLILSHFAVCLKPYSKGFRLSHICTSKNSERLAFWPANSEWLTLRDSNSERLAFGDSNSKRLALWHTHAYEHSWKVLGDLIGLAWTIIILLGDEFAPVLLTNLSHQDLKIFLPLP